MTTATFKAGYKTLVTRSPVIQPKLAVNRPGDPYEQEADAMADRVMRMPGKSSCGMLSKGLIGSSLQRKCEHCEEEEKKKKSLMRKTEGSGGGFAASPQLASRLENSKGGGAPLPANTRSFMENAFSRDFSQVRIHAGNEAHDMSHSIQARAFTHGNDLYFNSGQYQPNTSEGQRLLAHELTHVVQQEGDRTSQLQREIELRPPGKGEFSAFDRAGELINRLNTVHPEAITYSLDGNKIRCTVVEGAALTTFDSEMKNFIENTETLIPLRLISKHGLARPGGDPSAGFEPVVIDDYESGYVDLDDLLASEGITFQLNLIHFLKERFVTKNYKDRLGSQIPKAEFDKAHAAGQQEEVDVLRNIFDDPSIRLATKEPDKLNDTDFQFVYFSNAEKYTIFVFLKSPTKLLTKSTIRVRPAGKKKLVTVDEFLEERSKAKAAAPAVQPRLYVNNPGDRYEQEADAMADRVMRMSAVQAPAQHTQALIGPSVQRKCAQCEEAEKEEGIMRKAEGGGGLQASPALASKLIATKGNGAPLPDGTRHFMENAFSADFSRVSIHNNSEAADMNQSIRAHAFTHGNDIYFNSGRYSPHTQQGQHLLAHELTHTLQQTGGIHRSTGSEAGSGGTAPTSGAPGTTGTGAGATGGISVDVLAAANPEDFLVRAAAQELGTDIRVSSMDNMIDQLESLVPANGCLASLNIYNHGNPSIQVVGGGNKVKNADGTTSETAMSGFSLIWLSTVANQGALNRLRHLFCCNGMINWYGCSTIGVWAEGGTRTETERTSDSHRYTGTFGNWYQSVPEALARGAFDSFRYIGAVNAQMWADSTCTNLTAATDFTNWTTRDGRVTRTTAHGGTRYRYQPRTAAACSCEAATNRVAGAAASATELETRATQLREDWLRPHYERYRSVLGRTPTPPAETPVQVQERERRATEMQALGQTIRTAVLDRAGITGGASPTTSAEALQVAGRWGLTVTDIVSRLGPLAAATGTAVSGTTSGGSLDTQQRTLEAALTPRGRDTFMAMMAQVQQERFWADHFASNAIYVFPDLPPTARYRAYKQEGTRALAGGGTAPVYIIHMKKDMIDGGQSELATALLVHELSHTLFHGMTGEAMSGFLDELANLIVDDPQIVVLRPSSATPADRDRQARQIRQLLYDASAYAEEEIFVHLQQLTHMPNIDEGGRALSGPTYIRERVTDFMHQLFQIGLPAPALRQVITNLAAQTRGLYQRRIDSMPEGSEDRRLLEINRRLAMSTLQLAYDEARHPTPATP
ncbi:DUF4157 domain-containing protein [Chitinophaga sp. CF418]|uniref:eCIS core domain-containing protein n=1 Tax=Chitinophaga sp. CF418 TaxID=1855287 RepID=UPI0009149204|nr:DUF4157 domain-containing protein [Chitinophaga sp. CF418]SHN40831.1 protein of unknown function [Chitinophaga sp. CF418]